MYPREFHILWVLAWGGDHPRTAGDIAVFATGHHTARSIVSTLVSMRRRGLLDYDGDGFWSATDRAREVVAL